MKNKINVTDSLLSNDKIISELNKMPHIVSIDGPLFQENIAPRQNKLINVKSNHPVIKKGIVPERLLKATRDIFRDKNEFNLVKRIIHKLWNLHLQWSDDNEEGIFPLSYKYKKAIINNNNNFYFLFKKLEINGIYKSSSYSTAQRKCKKVKMNTDLISGKLVEIQYYQNYETEAVFDSVSKRVEQVMSKLEVSFSSFKEIQGLVENHRGFIETQIRARISSKLDRIFYKDKFINGPLENFINLKLEAVSHKHTTLLYSMLILEDAYYGRNSTNRRMDHPLTRMPSIYLSFFRLSGENLVEIDFKNCQPCLFAHFLKKVLKKESWIFKIPYINKLLSNIGIIDSNHSLFSDLENIVCQSDVQEFCAHCFNGRLYESLLGPNATKVDRNEMKRIVLLAMYGKYWNVKHSDRYEGIKNRYPNLLRVITLLKILFAKIHLASQMKYLKDKRVSRIGKKWKTAKEAGSDELSIMLQVIESYLFIDILLPKLLDAGLDVIPRHDSFIMKETDSEKVWEIITKTFNDILGKGKFQMRKKVL